MLHYGLQLSSCTKKVEAPAGSVADIVQRLAGSLSTETYDMVVRRGHVLQDGLKRARRDQFSPSKRIKVEFVGETGSDTGGLTREFFRLFGKSVVSTYLDGTGCFKHNAVALQAYVYNQIGQLVTMSVVQGGSGIHGLSNSVYNYLSGMPVSDIIVSVAKVPDPDVREMLEKVYIYISSTSWSCNLLCTIYENAPA